MSHKTASKKNKCKLIILGLIFYILIMSLFTVNYLNKNNLDLDKYDAIIIPGGEGGTGGTTPIEDKTYTIFDAQVIIMSNIDKDDKYKLHLFALPGQVAEIYRDFSIFMYSNQPANYLIKIDNQTHTTGSFNWIKRIDTRSEYRNIDILVILENATGVSRQFKFNNLRLIESPWVKSEDKDEGEDKIPDFIEPYIRMTQGEMNIFIAQRVFADIAAVVLGILFGTQLAAVKADLRGIERAM